MPYMSIGSLEASIVNNGVIVEYFFIGSYLDLSPRLLNRKKRMVYFVELVPACTEFCKVSMQALEQRTYWVISHNYAPLLRWRCCV